MYAPRTSPCARGPEAEAEMRLLLLWLHLLHLHLLLLPTARGVDYYVDSARGRVACDAAR